MGITFNFSIFYTLLKYLPLFIKRRSPIFFIDGFFHKGLYWIYVLNKYCIYFTLILRKYFEDYIMWNLVVLEVYV